MLTTANIVPEERKMFIYFTQQGEVHKKETNTCGEEKFYDAQLIKMNKWERKIKGIAH